jgi:hypothetical protein
MLIELGHSALLDCSDWMNLMRRNLGESEWTNSSKRLWGSSIGT